MKVSVHYGLAYVIKHPHFHMQIRKTIEQCISIGSKMVLQGCWSVIQTNLTFPDWTSWNNWNKKYIWLLLHCRFSNIFDKSQVCKMKLHYRRYWSTLFVQFLLLSCPTDCTFYWCVRRIWWFFHWGSNLDQ